MYEEYEEIEENAKVIGMKKEDQKQTDNNIDEWPWIIIFSGLSEEKKNRLYASRTGFFTNKELTTSVAINPEDIKKGFVKTESKDDLHYFSDKIQKYKSLKENIKKKEQELKKPNLIRTTLFGDFYKKKICFLSDKKVYFFSSKDKTWQEFLEPINIVLKNEETKERFSKEEIEYFERLIEETKDKASKKIDYDELDFLKQDKEDIKLKKNLAKKYNWFKSTRMHKFDKQKEMSIIYNELKNKCIINKELNDKELNYWLKKTEIKLQPIKQLT